MSATLPIIEATRRNFLMRLASAAIPFAIPTPSVLAEPKNLVSKNQMDAVQASLESLMNQYPNLQQLDAQYDARMKKKFAAPENPEFSLSRSYESRLSPRIAGMIRILSGAFNLDVGMMQRLVLQESKGEIGVTSGMGAQWLMQILPGTAYDLIKRYPLYEQFLKKIPKTLLAYSASEKTNSVISTFQNRAASQWEIQKALNDLVYDLFDPEMNLLVGHVFLAGMRAQLYTKIPQMQKSLANKYREFGTMDFTQFSKSRRAIGANPLSILHIQNTYANQLEGDPHLAANTLALVQYNGGPEPRSQYPYIYAAIVGIA